MKKKFEFKPFDKVLVRDSNDIEWSTDFFSHYEGERARTTGNCGWEYVIPYEGNEHLLGTTDPYAEPFDPKDGDFVVSGWKHRDKECEWIAIVKGDDFSQSRYDTYEGYFTKGGKKGGLLYCNLCTAQTYTRAATEEEKQLLISELHNAEKDWDAEKKEVVDWKWKPTDTSKYYYVNSVFIVENDCWCGCLLDERRYTTGNCFRTFKEAKAMAQRLATAIKEPSNSTINN